MFYAQSSLSLSAPSALFCAFVALSTTCLAAAPERDSESRSEPAAVFQDDDRKAEFKERYDAAKGDHEALWELHTWCEAFGMESEARRVLRAILKVEAGDRKAHEGLGHIEYKGQWFDSQEKLDKHLAEEAAAEAEAKGFVKFKGKWIDPKHIPFLEKGLVLGEDGSWLTPEEKQRLDEGWKQQDLVWVSPSEFENMDAGLWKVGEEWLTLAEANAHHAELGQWWKIPGETFELWTTLPRAKAEEAMGVMDKAVRDLEKFYGRRPELTPRVVLLNSLEQYNTVAAGEFQGTETDSSGLSGVYSGYFADIWWDMESLEFMRAAVAYWDPSSPTGDKFGLHAARYAAGMSFTEAIDPSPEFEAKFAKQLKGARPEYKRADLVKFWSEKRLPRFIRFGVPVWTERYFIDRTATGGADPTWPRKWSVSNIERRGGVDPVGKIFEMELEAGDQAAASQSGKKINQTGLLISFVVDGGHDEVSAAYEAWRAAFNGEGDYGAATEALMDALSDAEAAIRKYANS